MNAHAQIEALDFNTEFQEAAEEVVSNIVNIEPETELERHAKLHRRGVERFEARAAEALEHGKAAAEIFKQHRKDLREKYTADLAALRAQETQAKSETLTTIRTAERLAAAYRAGLAEIEKG